MGLPTVADLLRVMSLINQNKVYRLRKDSPVEYTNNIGIINSLVTSGYVAAFGNCRRDFFLTPAGKEFFEQYPEVEYAEK